MWEVEYTDEFDEWWSTLDENEQIDVGASVGLLEVCGPNLKFPTHPASKDQIIRICAN
jgi:hypothetical protein